MRFLKNTDLTGALPVTFLIAFVGGAFIGWCWNLAKAFEMMGEAGPASAQLAFRMFGILVFPIGCVLGWF